MTLDQFWQTIVDPRVMVSYRLTFGTSLIGALINVFFGFIVAWSLVRYRFPGRKILDALVDLPFALPTAVSGIALTAIYSKNGWIGSLLEPLGIKVAFTLLYGVILCIVRAMGEFGAVSIVSGHIRGKTNTLPLHIEILYNKYNVVAAFAMASILAMLGLITLVLKTVLEWKVQQQLRDKLKPTTAETN